MHDLYPPQFGKSGASPTPPTSSATQRARATLECVAAPAGSTLPLPRLLIVLAHPDDEVLAMGARLERLAAARLLTVTDGAPQDGSDARQHGFPSIAAYRAGRQDELAAALADAGIQLQALAPEPAPAPMPVPDQTATHHLAGLTRAIAGAITALAPEAVLTHPYEGGHPDHDACAFAVHTALRLLKSQQREDAVARDEAASIPVVIETPFYHAGNGGGMQTGTFLLEPESACTLVCELSAREQQSKQSRLRCFVSQQQTLEQFGTARELFRLAPNYDFTRPPHTGQLFYEQFSWGVDGARFRVLAAEAIGELSLIPSASEQQAGHLGQNERPA